MERESRRSFTLVELLVVIAIIGTLLALLLPAVQAARESARNNSCKNNIKQLATAFVAYDASQQRLPGYINALVDPNSPKSPAIQTHLPTIGRRASWVVMLFPYLEQEALWNQWSNDFVHMSDAPQIDILICPSDPPETPAQPWLSYIVNAGWALFDPHRASPPAAIRAADLVNREFLVNGVFFDDARNLNILMDICVPSQDRRETQPAIPSSISYVQSHDGTSNTFMLSENVHAWFWAYDADQDTPIWESGSRPDRCSGCDRDTKHAFGFVWSNSGAGIEKINGDNDYDIGGRRPAVMDMFTAWQLPPPLTPPASPEVTHYFESYGFPSSRHAGGVNMAFCDGRINFLAETIEPNIYAMLMTSNRVRSHFWDKATSVQDRKLPQPTDADY